MTISTERLSLVPLPPELVAALVAGDIEAAAALAPFPVDAGTFAGDTAVLAMRHAQLTADPTQWPWLLRAAVSRESGEVVAKGGFHAAPDAARSVEIGYRVDPPHRGQGLATEIALGLMGWAGENGAVACVASIRPDNLPSLAIARRLGFVRTGEQMDEIDGLEWVFTRPLDGTLPSYEPPR